MYNIDNYRKYLRDNKEVLMKRIEEDNKYVIENWEREVKYDDEIFDKGYLLFTHFLKWCCEPQTEN